MTSQIGIVDPNLFEGIGEGPVYGTFWIWDLARD